MRILKVQTVVLKKKLFNRVKECYSHKCTVIVPTNVCIVITLNSSIKNTQELTPVCGSYYVAPPS